MTRITNGTRIQPVTVQATEKANEEPVGQVESQIAEASTASVSSSNTWQRAQLGQDGAKLQIQLQKLLPQKKPEDDLQNKITELEQQVEKIKEMQQKLNGVKESIDKVKKEEEQNTGHFFPRSLLK